MVAVLLFSGSPTVGAPLSPLVAEVSAAEAETAKALDAIKADFPRPPEVQIPPQDKPMVSSVNKSRLIDPQNNPQMRDLYEKYKRNAGTFQVKSLAQNCRIMRNDLARDIPFQQNIVATSSPTSSATRDQYYVAKANLDWLQQQLTPWLDRASALLPSVPAKG